MGFNLKSLGKHFGIGNSLGGVSSFLMGTDVSGKQKADINGVLGPLQQQIGLQQGLAQSAALKQLGAINKGYGKANQALQMQGALGTKSIMDSAKQQYAGNMQSAIGRGLYGTTVLDAANRGTGIDQNNALAGLSAQLAQLGGGLQTQQAQDVANVYGNMSGLNQNYASILAQLGLGKLGAVQNVQYGKQGGALGDILKIGAAVL